MWKTIHAQFFRVLLKEVGEKNGRKTWKSCFSQRFRELMMREREVNPKNSTQNDLIERHPHIYIVSVQIPRIKKKL